MNYAVQVENVSKRYELGALRNREIQIRDEITRWLKSPFKRRVEPEQILWALKDVSFNVPEGEIVGIIGGNGAGKSTLLKVLSKITYPTHGRIRTAGRVASLLEVGTGFHEELTGRENIFLNGSILGMRKREVEAQLDAIVAFSGVERFIDTPIKRYSSGMRLRLGFAVAAHLNPDVLIVDEVLAVGDAGFQKKCLSAMEDLRSGGRTVLFVSHHMAAVESLCNRGIWIDRGQLRLDGPVRPVIDAYMSTFGSVSAAGSTLENIDRKGSGEIRYTKVEILDENRETKNFVRPGDPVVVRLYYTADRQISHPSFGFRILTDTGTLITETGTYHHGIHIDAVEAGDGYLELEIDALNLIPARYYLTLGLTGAHGHMYDFIDHAVRLDVEGGKVYDAAVQFGSECGVAFFPQRWNIDALTIPRTRSRTATG